MGSEETLTLRKLGEGEAFKIGGRYYWVSPESDTWGVFHALSGPVRFAYRDYYELPPLSSEPVEMTGDPPVQRRNCEYELPPLSSEPVEMTGDPPVQRRNCEPVAAKVESLAGEVTEPWTREVTPDPAVEKLLKVARETGEQLGKVMADVVAEHHANAWQAPAPNQVGERLTSPPEVGTPVIVFGIGNCLIGEWDETCNVSDNSYYRYLGEIPVEPEPAKVEPPKWPKLGLIEQQIPSTGAWKPGLVIRIESAVGATVGYDVMWQDGKTSLLWADDITRKPRVRLITDDPAYPPSPELAALFGEEAS